MGWNGKNDVIVMIFLSCGGLGLIALSIGYVVPIIANIKDGGFEWIIKIIVLLGLMGFAIYILRCINKKKKTKN